MAKYRITDQQSGKTLVINGDKPPSEQEAESLFQSSGIRGQQEPQKNLVQQVGDVMAPISKFLMPNVINYSADSLQKIGSGDLTPNAPTAVNTLTSALGPGGQQLANLFVGSEQDKQKDAAVRELYSTLQGVKGVAKAIPALGKQVVNAGKNAVEIAQNAAEAKSINPWKVVGHARNKAAESAGDLNTESLIKTGDEFITKNPYAKEAWEAFKPTITDKMKATDLLDRMTNVFGQAYTKGGDVRATAEAGLMNKLYQAGREAIKTQAPDVAKQSQLFKLLYETPKAIQRGTWLALKTTAIGKMLGM